MIIFAHSSKFISNKIHDKHIDLKITVWSLKQKKNHTLVIKSCNGTVVIIMMLSTSINHLIINQPINRSLMHVFISSLIHITATAYHDINIFCEVRLIFKIFIFFLQNYMFELQVLRLISNHQIECNITQFVPMLYISFTVYLHTRHCIHIDFFFKDWRTWGLQTDYYEKKP